METDQLLLSANDAWSDVPWVSELVDFVGMVIKDYPTIRFYGGSLAGASTAVVSDHLISGVCFGHQIICRALGGSVGKNPGGWEIGPTALQTTPMGRLIYDAEKIVSVIYVCENTERTFARPTGAPAIPSRCRARRVFGR
jgi:hypothetical protein